MGRLDLKTTQKCNFGIWYSPYTQPRGVHFTKHRDRCSPQGEGDYIMVTLIQSLTNVFEYLNIQIFSLFILTLICIIFVVSMKTIQKYTGIFEEKILRALRRRRRQTRIRLSIVSSASSSLSLSSSSPPTCTTSTSPTCQRYSG